MNFEIEHRKVENKWSLASNLETGDVGFIKGSDSSRYIGCFAIVLKTHILVYPPKGNASFIMPEYIAKHGVTIQELEVTESFIFRGKVK